MQKGISIYTNDLFDLHALLCCLGMNTILYKTFWSVSGMMKEKYPGIAEALAIMRSGFIPAYSLGLIYVNLFFLAF